MYIGHWRKLWSAQENKLVGCRTCRFNLTTKIQIIWAWKETLWFDAEKCNIFTSSSSLLNLPANLAYKCWTLGSLRIAFFGSTRTLLHTFCKTRMVYVLVESKPVSCQFQTINFKICTNLFPIKQNYQKNSDIKAPKSKLTSSFLLMLSCTIVNSRWSLGLQNEWYWIVVWLLAAQWSRITS